MKKPKIEPCPWCGGTPTFICEGKSVKLRCKEHCKDMQVETFWCTSEKEAIKLWNDRAEPIPAYAELVIEENKRKLPKNLLQPKLDAIDYLEQNAVQGFWCVDFENRGCGVNALIELGYRKKDEVAAEILQEIGGKFIGLDEENEEMFIYQTGWYKGLCRRYNFTYKENTDNV